MGRDRRIFFVNPPYERIAPGYAFIKHLANRSPSLPTRRPEAAR